MEPKIWLSWCHKTTPNYMGYTIYILYIQIFFILIVESNFKWLQIEMVVKHITSKPFVCILTIGLGWDNLKYLHKNLCHK
jgi:hypothetical protein